MRDVDPERIVAAASKDPDEAVDRLEAALRHSVEIHLASDVPVAVMCSGGVDSSLVTAYAREVLPDVAAYVADVGGDVGEGEQAGRVARHLGVALRRIDVDREAHLRLLPHTTWHLEAPNCHPSDTALLMVTRRCRQDGIKVLLTGEGSDELFGGYPWQAKTWRAWRKKETLRYRLRSGRARRRRDRERAAFGPLESDFLRHHPPVRWRLLGILGPDAQLRSRRIFTRLAPVEPGSDRAFLAQCIEDLYRHLSSILQRHDRMGMAASMEMRVPFLENAIIDFALHAPRRWKLEGGRGKWVVKRAAERHLPHDIVHASKKGFPVPDAFRRNMVRFLRGGALEEALGWSEEATKEIVSLAHVDEGAHRVANAEIWARIFLRGEDPDEVGEQLVHALA